MKILCNVWAFSLMALLSVSCNNTEKYKDSTQPIDVRVNDLLGRMTLEEKASQLDMLCAKDIVVDGKNLSEERLKTFIDDKSIGSVHDLYPETAEIANEIQKRALENSRLGIPLLFIEEGLHGYQGVGSTTFPAAIGNSCTWDTTLVNQIGRIIGTEARIHGVHFILGPNLDVAHEIRWGRVEETFGEDPYLTSRMAVNLIKGMQKNNELSNKHAVVSEPKHFGVHGIPSGGTNASTVNIGEREARTTHLYTFEKAITEGGANGVMAAYHDIDGVPSIANKKLLSQILRDEWGFKGMVVSDLGAVNEQIHRHHTAVDAKDAISKALTAGLNMQFYDFPYDVWQNSIVEAVKDGTLDEKILDQRVADVLRLKFRLGLFEDPYISNEEIAQLHHCKAHKDVALKASHESLVLLKNNNNVLPFQANPKRITLVGELANLSLLGGYSPSLAKGITVLEALKERFGKDVHIDFIESQIENSFKSIPNSALYTSNQGDNGVKVEFFNNTDLHGNAAYSATVPEVTAYWHNLSPAPGINRDNFSARWEGVIKAPVSGTYEIKLEPDNLGKLFLNGNLVIDKWEDPDAPNVTKIQLSAGQMIPFKVEYAELHDNAGIHLDWRVLHKISNEQLYNRITSSASASDVTIVVLGEGIDAVGEGKDRQDLNMCERDIEILKAVKKANKPAATIVMNGRPFVMTPMEELSDAIIEGWFPGEFGGQAVVDILFGDVNPSGKLCISIPRSEGQLPANYLKKRSSRMNYTDGSAYPLFTFGHGLSYTTFEYNDLQFSSKEISTTENMTVSFKVKNTGKVKGAEVCQLYMTDIVSSVSLAGKNLRGFSRVELEPGEEKTVEITLTPHHFSLVNSDMQRVVEPGDFEIMIGASSADIKLKDKVTLK